LGVFGGKVWREGNGLILEWRERRQDTDKKMKSLIRERFENKTRETLVAAHYTGKDMGERQGGEGQSREK